MNDDLIDLIISQLDITLYAVTKRSDLFSSLGADCHENILDTWWKNSNCHTKQAGIYKRWYVNGKLHRENGPAIERL